MPAYDDYFRSECLVRLAVNNYDFEKTADEMHVSTKSLRRWAEHAEKKTVPELLERAVEKILANIPTNMDARDWAVAAGILLDKLLLFQGRPNLRSETVTRDLTGSIEALSEDERDAVADEARRIIEEAKSGKSSPASLGSS